ncbi:unnamed protein product [Discosporangium mesarthrocarpum]
MARFFASLSCVLLLAANAAAFLVPASRMSPRLDRLGSSYGALRMGYVPDGVSPEEYQRIRAKEIRRTENLGRIGITKFKSRSMRAWIASGAKHIFPGDPKSTPKEKLAYMQRKDGSWDNSDLGSGLKKMWVPWTKDDEDYANGGEERAKSRSIWGTSMENDTPWVV